MLETRPWGSFEIINKGEGYQVKKIVVKPFKRLSLQSHKHRDEHWYIVSGDAEVDLGDQMQTSSHVVRSGGSVDIKKHQAHRIKNIGEIDLVFIEVQTGSIIDEKDIFRFQDDFGRAAFNEKEDKKMDRP
jgi:mannose-1-phosphate guanylyltransferase